MQLIKFSLIFSIAFFIFNSNAAEVPVPQGAQILEYQKTGNTYTWSPVGSSTPKGPGTVSFPATSTVSDVSPKVTSTGSLPYDHKGGSAAKVVVSTPVNTTKLAAGAASVAAAAAAGKIKPGNPWVVSAQIAGLMVGPFVASDLVDWGLYQFNKSANGDVTADVLSSDQHPVSTGIEYFLSGQTVGYPTAKAACEAMTPVPPEGYMIGLPPYINPVTFDCHVFYSRIGGGFGFDNNLGKPNQRSSNCPSGTPIVEGVCTPNAPPKVDSVPLTEFFERAINEKPWSAVHASVVAGVIQAGHNVFTDGTDGAISGPEYVPLTTAETSWPVNVIEGTATPAPSGYTGATQPGTVTQTTVTTAKNSFSPGSSSGGQSSGPSMTTSQKETTTTTVTNNITNTTNILNQTITEKDESPEQAPTDTPFADLPELYKQKYPDGLIGVLRTQFTAMKATPLFQLPTQLMGDLPETGQCPSWQVDLNLTTWANFGTRTIGADCAIWEFASWVIVISAFILARALVFGG
ncbi:hypothetical protein [Comamonas aquatica]|uniref:hypothetical protein n=1 Tax=Comamonas aquatica TaxID=225991 RepID=UPI00244C7A7F|nr:hypothetical protein [Comamonas aquatica]MDH0495789.1 hypothetical protein [Comamonas aquatica]